VVNLGKTHWGGKRGETQKKAKKWWRGRNPQNIGGKERWTIWGGDPKQENMGIPR